MDDYDLYRLEWTRRYGHNLSACIEYKEKCWLTFGRLDYESYCREVKSLPFASDAELDKVKVVLLMDGER